MAGVLVTNERRLAGHTSPVSSVAFTPDGRRLFSASHDRTLRVWDVSTGRPERTLQRGRRMSDVAVAPDGSLAGGTATTGQLLLWSAASGELLSGEVVDANDEGATTAIAFSPDGAW